MLVEVYGDTAPTINHVGNGFNVSRMETSTLKTSLALDSQKKFEDKELEASLEEDQSHTQEELAESLGDNSTSRFCTIESHGNDSKTRKLGALN